ncbi:Periplasmic nitrate reductase [Rhizoctonia solani]|uniref:Periplasmic nitrate reductase n=1 Tax=Rhizoctonia solani TaxID=456999 RepID=A0A0K6G998_9AGAM|nr:Periplasmic nitrate reductase [Rhizoctonia solani]
MRTSNKKIKLRLAAERAQGVYMRNIKSQSLASPEPASPGNQPTGAVNYGNSNINWPRQLSEEPPVATESGSGGEETNVQASASAPQMSNNLPTQGKESEKSLTRRPPTIQEANNALEKVSDAIRTLQPGGGYTYHELDHTTRDRFTAMRACLINYLRSDSKGFIVESLVAAQGQCKSLTYARSIRKWIRELIETGDLPYFQHRWWNVPLLGDEDIGREIKAHLQVVGKQACAEAIVNFFSDTATQTRLGVSKPISLRTAQRWMSKYGGFRWRKEPKGQYFDGHERADVVDYRQKTYVPFMRAIERLTEVYNEKGAPDPQRPILLYPGEKPIIVWFHDESIFFANDRRLVRWVGADEHATPFKKGDGNTIMIADFVSAQLGWLRGQNGESARVIFRPGINRDGYFTCARVVKQLKDAIKIVQEAFPEYTHIFIYDNAPSHTKRPEDAISARTMPKGEVENFPRPYTVKGANGTSQKVTPPRMEPGRLPDGTAQSFYWPDDHEPANRRGWFKGMAQILRERGLQKVAEKRAECPGFKCEPGKTDCCCRRALLNQPDFESRDSNLEEAARELGTRVIFLPKYHCELNPIEQCWGFAKEKYRKMPPTNREAVMIRYILDAIDSIPLETIRKYAARSQRFVDANFIHKLDRFTFDVERGLEFAHHDLFSAIFTCSKPKSGPPPDSLLGDMDLRQESQPLSGAPMDEDIYSTSSYQVPTDVTPMFQSIGIDRLDPYPNIGAGRPTSSLTDHTDLVARQDRNPGDGRPWPSHLSRHQPSDTRLLSNQAALTYMDPRLTTARLTNSPARAGSLPKSPQLAPKLNRPHMWTKTHTGIVIGSHTSSQAVYDKIMGSSRNLRLPANAQAYWGEFTQQAGLGDLFTPSYVGDHWWSAVDTCYDLADFAAGADATLKSNVPEFTNLVRQKTIEQLDCHSGEIGKFKVEMVPEWLGNPNDSWFARLWRRHLGRNVDTPPKRGRSLLRQKGSGVSLSEVSMTTSTASPSAEFSYSAPTASLLSSPRVHSQSVELGNRHRSFSTTMDLEDEGSPPDSTSPPVPFPSAINVARSERDCVQHRNLSPGSRTALRLGPENSAVPERRVRTKRESLASQSELVRQGATLTDNHTEISREKAKVMDTFIKNANVSATADMALVHTRVIESLSSISHNFIEIQGNLAIQAFNIGSNATNAAANDVGNGAATSGQASTNQLAVPVSRATNDLGRALAEDSLASLRLILGMNPNAALSTLISAASQVVSSSTELSVAVAGPHHQESTTGGVAVGAATESVLEGTSESGIVGMIEGPPRF